MSTMSRERMLRMVLSETSCASISCAGDSADFSVPSMVSIAGTPSTAVVSAAATSFTGILRTWRVFSFLLLRPLNSIISFTVTS